MIPLAWREIDCCPQVEILLQTFSDIPDTQSWIQAEDMDGFIASNWSPASDMLLYCLATTWLHNPFSFVRFHFKRIYMWHIARVCDWFSLSICGDTAVLSLSWSLCMSWILGKSALGSCPIPASQGLWFTVNTTQSKSEPASKLLFPTPHPLSLRLSVSLFSWPT